MEINAAGIALDGVKIGTDQAALEAALGQSAVATIDVRAEADAPPSLVLAVLTLKAGPQVARRLLTWQGIDLSFFGDQPRTVRGDDPQPASIVSWRANGATQLWSVTEGPLANLGPFELEDEKAEPSVTSNLSKVCAATGCRLNVELREQRLQTDLQAWQRIVAPVGSSLELRVRAAPALPRNLERPAAGHLPPEMIQAVVRRGFYLLRNCYEAGLRRDRNLEGRVSVSFVIERDGSVKNSSDGGSDLPDEAVRACVVRQFRGLKFPPPEGGIVTVVYPIMLAPG